MTNTTPPDWVLIEAAKRCDYIPSIENRRKDYALGGSFRALCDMILKHEQPPVDRKLLCAREAMRQAYEANECVSRTIVSAIELWEEGFGR